MKVTPYNDILIDGQHAATGKPFETSEITARSLVAQGLAYFAVVKPVEVATAKAPTAETAALEVKETAATRRRK